MSATISLLLLDVDGVLTDGSLPFVGAETAGKVFHVRDGSALKLWQRQGGRVAILSGRDSPMVAARARELGIEDVVQGASDKGAAYDALSRRLGIHDAEVCFVGDDLPDLPVLRRVGLPVAVADAASPVKRVATFVTRAPGGRGAAAEVVEYLLRRAGRWDDAMRSVGA